MIYFDPDGIGDAKPLLLDNVGEDILHGGDKRYILTKTFSDDKHIAISAADACPRLMSSMSQSLDDPLRCFGVVMHFQAEGAYSFDYCFGFEHALCFFEIGHGHGYVWEKYEAQVQEWNDVVWALVNDDFQRGFIDALRATEFSKQVLTGLKFVPRFSQTSRAQRIAKEQERRSDAQRLADAFAPAS